MSTRVLDWDGLVAVAGRRNPPDRIITVAGQEARVVRLRSPQSDPGFYIRAVDTADDLAPVEWALRTDRELAFLRRLVDAGLVTVDDEEDRWRSAEWAALLADTARGCFISGCGAPDIDQRGPVIDDRQRMHKACPGHWEGVFAVLGAQHAQAPETAEIAQFGSAEPVRVLCVICGAGPDTPHDAYLHTGEAGRRHRDAGQ